jgi:hypothetical protein
MHKPGKTKLFFALSFQIAVLGDKHLLQERALSPLYQWRQEWMKTSQGSEGVFEERRVMATMTCGPFVVVSPPAL